MSDEFPEQPALIGPVRARNISRLYKGLADQFEASNMPRQAATALQNSQWWLTYSVSLAQIGPGAIDEDGR